MAAVTPANGPARVLVVGDANPDLVLRGDVVPRFGQVEQLLEGCSLVIGGSAAITAHGFARLERPVSLVAAVGKDLFGSQICRDLAAAGVDIDPVVHRVDEPTGVTVVLSNAADRAILTLPGAIPTLSLDEVLQALAALHSVGLRHVHVSSPFLQPTLAAELSVVLAQARAGGISTSVDTNGDPADAWLGVRELLPLVDVLLPNRAEVAALGRDPDPRSAAASLARQGPLVVVKNGPAGAFAVGPSGAVLECPGRPSTELDTTGAGDSFDAAFLDGWLDGEALDECLRRGVIAGAMCVTGIGGTANQPDRADLMRKDS
jgi:ribokinase